MAEMKGDMGGAACTVASIEAACRLGLDINVIGLIALTENMPSGTAIKPGDVLTAMNGKTVEVSPLVNHYRLQKHFIANSLFA